MKTINQDDDSRRQEPTVKRNIGCGVLLLVGAFGALIRFFQGGTGGDPMFVLGGLILFAVMIYFGIKMIKGKKLKD